MAQILVSPEGVASLRSTVQTAQRQNSSNAGALSSILSQLDFEASSAEEIKRQIRTLQSRLTQQTDKMECYARMLQQVSDQFVSADKRISKEADTIRYAPVVSSAILERLKETIEVDIVPPLEIQHVGKSWEHIKDIFPTVVIGVNTAIPNIGGAIDWIQGILGDDTVSAGTYPEDGQAIYENLQKNDPSLLFGEYNFSVHFIEDVGALNVFMYGAKNWKETLGAIVKGGFTDATIAEVYMDDPDKCKSYLREVIDNLCGTEYLDVYSSEAEDAMDALKDLAELCGYKDMVDLVHATKLAAGNTEMVDKMFKDYSANIAMLHSLKDTVPSGTVLSETVGELISEYQNQAHHMLMDDLIGKVEDAALDYIGFGSVDAVVQTVLGEVPSLNAMDSVIYTSSMRTDAIIAFKEAAEVIRSGNFTESDLNRYRTSFDMAKSLTIEQYEGMISHYEKGSTEASYLRDQIQNLKAMTYDNFNYATQYSDFRTVNGGRGF